jgi:hypothetical protein
MVKVFYWHPNTSDKPTFRKDKNDYGHIAISASTNGEEIYISFYPETRLPLGSLILPMVTVKSDLKTYEEDLAIMESVPDYIIEITDLNSDLVYEYLKCMPQKSKKYNLYFNNCSSVVYDALMNCSKARKYTIQYFLFKFYHNGMKDEKKILNNFLHGYGRFFYQTFERSGFVSPFRVLSFAKFMAFSKNKKNKL